MAARGTIIRPSQGSFIPNTENDSVVADNINYQPDQLIRLLICTIGKNVRESVCLAYINYILKISVTESGTPRRQHRSG